MTSDGQSEQPHIADIFVAEADLFLLRTIFVKNGGANKNGKVGGRGKRWFKIMNTHMHTYPPQYKDPGFIFGVMAKTTKTEGFNISGVYVHTFMHIYTYGYIGK